MTPTDVRTFIKHWHAAVRTEVTEISDHEFLAACENKLQETITNDQASVPPSGEPAPLCPYVRSQPRTGGGSATQPAGAVRGRIGNAA